MNSEAKRQVDLHPEAMIVWIDFNHPKLQMKDSKAGLAAERLSDDRRPRRIDAGNVHIKYTSPSGGVREERPHGIGRRIDDGRWAARISSPVTNILQSI